MRPGYPWVNNPIVDANGPTQAPPLQQPQAGYASFPRPMNVPPRSLNFLSALNMLPEVPGLFGSTMSNDLCDPFSLTHRPLQPPPVMPYVPYRFVEEKQQQQQQQQQPPSLPINPNMPFSLSQTLGCPTRPFPPLNPSPYVYDSNSVASFLWPLASLDALPYNASHSISPGNMIKSNSPSINTIPKLNNINFPPYILGAAPSFKKKKFICRMDNICKFKAYKSTFRKNNDNFILDPSSSTVLAIGPRRTYCKEIGYVKATGEGSSPNIIAIGESAQVCNDYMSWMQKKIRARVENEATNKIINIIDVPLDNVEIDLFELHHFISYAFPHWHSVYEPDITPLLAIQRKRPFKNTKSGDAKAAPSSPSSSSSEMSEHIHRTSPTPSTPAGDPMDHVASTPAPNMAPNQDMESHDSESLSKKEPDTSEILSIEKYILSKTADPDFKRYTPLGIIATWMYVEEKRHMHRDKAGRNSSSWLESVLLISQRNVLIHRVQKNEDLELAWVHFFPLLRYFLIAVPTPSIPSPDILNTNHLSSCTTRNFSNPPNIPWPFQMQSPNFFCPIPGSRVLPDRTAPH